MLRKRINKSKILSVVLIVLSVAVIAAAAVMSYRAVNNNRFRELSGQQTAGVYREINAEDICADLYVDVLTGYVYSEYGPVLDENGEFFRISGYED